MQSGRLTLPLVGLRPVSVLWAAGGGAASAGQGTRRPGDSCDPTASSLAPEGRPEAGGHGDKRVVTDSDHEHGGDTRGAAGESGGDVTYAEAPQGTPPWRS